MTSPEFEAPQYAKHLLGDLPKYSQGVRQLMHDETQFGIWITGFSTATLALLLHYSHDLAPWLGWGPIQGSLGMLTLSFMLGIVHRWLYLRLQQATWLRDQWLHLKLMARARSLDGDRTPPEAMTSWKSPELLRHLETYFGIKPENISPLHEHPELLQALYSDFYADWNRANDELLGDLFAEMKAGEGIFIAEGIPMTEPTKESRESELREQAKKARATGHLARWTDRVQFASTALFLSAVGLLGASGACRAPGHQPAAEQPSKLLPSTLVEPNLTVEELEEPPK